MKDQRWPGDDETIGSEFGAALREERTGMSEWNRSFSNDFIAPGRRRFDEAQLAEMEPSACQQLDTVGMQPHAREYLERKSNCVRSDWKFDHMTGQMVDYPQGIQFSGMP